MIEEPGSSLAHEAYRDASTAVTSAVAHVEATAALARMKKGNRISSPEFAEGLTELAAYWQELFTLPVTDEAIREASQAAIEHSLRAYDSVHLATAMDFARSGQVTLACWDHELRSAARKRGIPLLPAEL